MELRTIENKGTYYELRVDLSIFGEIYEAIFIVTPDARLSTEMCDACPLYKDCFERDTLKYEICCLLELKYPVMVSRLGLAYMKPDSALMIKEIIDEVIGRNIEDDEPENKDEQHNPQEEPETESTKSKPLMNWETMNQEFIFL